MEPLHPRDAGAADISLEEKKTQREGDLRVHLISASGERFFSAASERYDAVHHLVTHEIGSTIRPARQRLTHRRFLLSFMLSPLFYASATDWDDKKTPSCVCRPKSETSVQVVRWSGVFQLWFMKGQYSTYTLNHKLGNKRKRFISNTGGRDFCTENEV